MSSTRITISVPAEVAAKAQRAVESGEAESVSGWFTALGEREPDWASARVVLDEMIDEAGGITDEDRAWARAVLSGGHVAPPPPHLGGDSVLPASAAAPGAFLEGDEQASDAS